MRYEEGIDICCVNFRTPNDLSGFCASLLAFPPSVPYTVYIYNVSPLARDLIESRHYVQLLRNNGAERAEEIGHTDNVGYGTAVNTCAKRGRKKVFAAFNADVKITEGSLDKIYAAMMEHGDWGVVGPRQIESRMGTITHGGIVGAPDSPRFRTWHTHTSGYEDVLDDVPTVMGAAYFVRRECWDELCRCELYQEYVLENFGTFNFGAFLPTKLYYEETFCSYHAREHGWKVVYFGEATLIHEWHRAIHQHMSPTEDDAMIQASQQVFRKACAAVHGMLCD
jgi:GT2 family glycosyltransferase